MELKKILVPTDFSEEANNALRAAVAIGQPTNAEISLLNVIDVPVVGHADALNILGGAGDSDDPELYKMYMHKLLEVTKEKIDAVKAEYPEANIKEHVVFDDLAKHLSEFVIEDETDLIVMGSKGASGMEELLVGSNTEKVIRTAKAPVLTVKNRIESLEMKNIVFASAFQSVSAKAVDSLKKIQNLLGATIHFVKIVTPNTFETTPDTLALIERFAKENNFENFTAHGYNYYSEEEGIRAFSTTINADMICMTTHGRTGIAHMLMGSIAEEVANHSVLPVLTFNQHFK